jgi:hypothetical protein
VIFSALSLFLLPIGTIFKEVQLFGLKSYALQILNTQETTYRYPIAAVNRSLVFLFFILQLARSSTSIKLYNYLYSGIVIGAIISSLAGILEYASIISLSWYAPRISDDVLQSTFRNRGWFTEFIIVIFPFIFSLELPKLNRSIRNILIGIGLLLFGFSIIFAGARTGWLAFPISILIFLVLITSFSMTSIRKWFRIKQFVVFSVLIGCIAAFSISTLHSTHTSYLNTNSTGNEVNEKKKQYLINRISNFFETGRLQTWKDTFSIASMAPVFGMGYETYSWHSYTLNTISKVMHDWKKHSIYHRLPKTAHNLYLQMFVSGGIVGLSLWVIIAGSAVCLLLYDIRRNQSMMSVCVFLSTINWHVYGLFQSMQYIPIIWMMIFLNFGYVLTLISAGESSPKTILFLKKLVPIYIVLLSVAGVVFYYNTGFKWIAKKTGAKIYSSDSFRDRYLGFFHPENWNDEVYRWTGKLSTIKLPGSGVLDMKMICHTPNVEKDPVQLTIHIDNTPIDDLHIFQKGAVQRRYYIHDRAGEKPRMNLSVSRTWNPAKSGLNSDNRDLGIAVREVQYVDMPDDGIGFYGWEDWNGAHPLQSRKKDAVRFRWTGMRASIPVETHLNKDIEAVVLYLHCAHPNIGDNPVSVQLLADGTLIRELNFSDHNWKEVVVRPHDLDGAGTLTIQVSRVWNPKKLGISEDTRDLGVGMTIIEQEDK